MLASSQVSKGVTSREGSGNAGTGEVSATCQPPSSLGVCTAKPSRDGTVTVCLAAAAVVTHRRVILFPIGPKAPTLCPQWSHKLCSISWLCLFLPAHVRGSAHGSQPRHQINAWSNLKSAPCFSSEFLLHLDQPCSSCLDCQGPPQPQNGHRALSSTWRVAQRLLELGCTQAGCCSCRHEFRAYFSLVSGQPQTSKASNQVCIFPVLLLFLTGHRS